MTLGTRLALLCAGFGIVPTAVGVYIDQQQQEHVIKALGARFSDVAEAVGAPHVTLPSRALRSRSWIATPGSSAPSECRAPCWKVPGSPR